jgi:thiol:disulfide interchange protein DsbD
MLCAAGHAGAAEPQPLRPEQAFRYQATAEGDDIVVRWTIEPGYYLYKERMSFATKTPGVELGPAALPAGIPYHDEFFGDMHVYRNAALVRIPVVRAGSGQLALEIRSQGCADIGLCYPPQVWTTNVVLAAATASADDNLSRLLRAGPAAPDAPLPAEKVFRVSAELASPSLLRITWDIAEGYYLYRGSLKVESASPGLTLGALRLPAGTPKEDEYFGKTQVFYREVVGEMPVTGSADPLQLRISHQGCKEDSVCYLPQTMLITVSGTPVASATAPAGAAPVVSEQDRLAGMIGSSSVGLVMLTFAGLGLLLSFTPCCLPMVPILSGLVVGHGQQATAARGFALSLAYVLGMAVTYTAAGAAFAAAGQQIQAALQQSWIIVGVAALFVALALAMFGLYELQVPAALLNRVTAASGRQRAGTFAGAAIMGALSALVVTTCVAPPLVATLTVIAQTGDTMRGALALFALSIGMGLPLLAVGASAGRLVPRAGPWMTTIKGAFGFMMLGLAIWMLDRILDDSLAMALWAVLVFMAGVFLGAFQTLDASPTVRSRLAKGAGLLAALYGAALLLGAFGGAEDKLQPLRAFGGRAPAEETRLGFKRIKTVDDLEQEIAAAAGAGQPLMLDFYADWCTSCVEMERYTFTSAAVQEALAGAVVLQADVTANDEHDKALLARFRIFGPPTIVFFGPDGRERGGYRVVGFKSADDFARHVRSAIGA